MEINYRTSVYLMEQLVFMFSDKFSWDAICLCQPVPTWSRIIIDFDSNGDDDNYIEDDDDGEDDDDDVDDADVLAIRDWQKWREWKW